MSALPSLCQSVPLLLFSLFTDLQHSLQVYCRSSPAAFNRKDKVP